MILPITRYTAQLAFKLQDFITCGTLTDLQLLIMRGEWNEECGCKENYMGSPLYLHGCWPFHPTDVDLANPIQPDFPVLVYDSFDVDEEGRVVFNFDDRLWELPDGRYTGVLRVRPVNPPINLPQNIPKLEPLYSAQSYYTLAHRLMPCGYEPPTTTCTPADPVCILTTFDIDLQAHCAQHMVSQVNVIMTRTACQFEGDE